MPPQRKAAGRSKGSNSVINGTGNCGRATPSVEPGILNSAKHRNALIACGITSQGLQRAIIQTEGLGRFNALLTVKPEDVTDLANNIGCRYSNYVD